MNYIEILENRIFILEKLLSDWKDKGYSRARDFETESLLKNTPFAKFKVEVIALIPEFGQVKIKDDFGRMYSITRKTENVDLTSLYVGQQLQVLIAPNTIVLKVIS